jgi:SAM-dependent methyltransferase
VLTGSAAAFDAYAADYDAALDRGLVVTGEEKEYYAAGRVAHIKRRLDAYGLTPRRMMDYGCGTGATAPLLLGSWSGATLVAVDSSAASIHIARAQYGTDAARFEVLQDYTPSGDCDLVYCNGVFHHIPPNERAATLRYVHAALAPGGVFALCENNPWNPGTRYVMSRIPFDRDAIPLSPPVARRLLAANGFDVMRTDSIFFFPRALSWLRPLEPALARFPLGGQYIVVARKRA